jgi:hypothetical protein
METELFLELPVAGKEIKVLINRHCMKDMVFYSVELTEHGQTTECHFMTYDKDEWTYKFVPSPSFNKIADKEEEFSEYIFRHFHDYCLN